MKIHVNNPVWAAITPPEYRDILMPVASYSAFYYKYNYEQQRNVRFDYRKELINKKGLFLAGLIPRFRSYLEQKGITCEVIDHNTYSKRVVATPYIKGITFRPDQARAIKAAVDNKRGVIIAPTGSGKTVVLGGIASCFPKGRTLFLCHTKDLLQQTYEEFKKFGFKNIGIINQQNRSLEGDIVIAIRQSFIKLDPEEYMDYFDQVLIDECHHSKDSDSQIVEILSNMVADVRIGVSATFPGDKASQLTIEGAIGPIINELTVEEGIELGILSKPIIKIRKTAYQYPIHDLRLYKDVYQQGIVDNYARNRQIMMDVAREMERGNSTLTFVSKIEHGENLLQVARSMGIDGVHFIHGETDDETRSKVKKGLMNKKIKAVIATTIWDEGVNIPSLNVIVNAAGGKSEIKALQRIGRGLRTAEGKDTVIVYDYFDPSHHFLIGHFGERFTLYCEKGWIA